MIEPLLNLAWLAIAVAAFGRVALKRDRRRVAAAFVATACVVALLFPIISITDDLVASIAAVEETIAVRRAMAAAAEIVVAVTVFPIAPHLLTFVVDEAFALPAAPALDVVALRGPPPAGC